MSYRIRNWTEYNAGMKQRGSLIFWLDDEALSAWEVEAKSGKRGASKTYSDVAIAILLQKVSEAIASLHILPKTT